MSEGTHQAGPVNQLPISKVQTAWLEWYRSNKRDLPWRRTLDPYRIWLSEVMLQQTQVDTALGYYTRFLERFPTLDVLAKSDVDEVMELWAGLGYYRRARNFHAAVREVAAVYAGEVPNDPKSFGALPGVGPYTTGAVMSIAFGEPIPAVDGNVLRVLSRLGGISDPIDRTTGRRQIEALATQLVSHENPGEWNQAVMELGALVCRPTSPKCDICPIREWCRAAQDGTTGTLPLVSSKAQVRVVDRLVAAVRTGEALMFQRRPEEGLLAGMWDLPALEGEPDRWLLPGDREQALLEFLAEQGFGNVTLLAACGKTSHRFSHVEWRMWVYLCEGDQVPEGYVGVPNEQVSRLTLAKATQRALKLAMEGLEAVS